ncbi:MAG TPA: helix-turn-helix domain-containing protein [Ferrovibrio sp.]|jgi:transcriptional regulator with XRE-family HTH domain|uniref:helix-turn-helix domain-containing protein n=1 Tax=Ferrovibrio sp. TaxID=1917215 RepID=UPI002B4B1137|nr:helix-turn-helix domain-containing protein [Ferrovibrio sp.]HLT76023.1 helix-turn-helix domain-containing protein [Ferrovibrio sp.]
MRKPNPYDAHVGSRLRACRTLAGFSQERLGAAVNLSFQQIQKYEKGLNRIGASRLQQFAQILNVPPSYFFEDMPGIEQQPTARPEHSVVSEIEQDRSPVSRRQALELVRNFGKITDSTVRDRIFQLIKAAATSYSGKAEGEEETPPTETVG